MSGSSSSRWRERQARDPYVRKARAAGLRSRAVFKLEEIERKDQLLRPGAVVVDLGSAPGAWSQYAAGRVGPRGRVVALDVLAMPEIPGVRFIQGDFTDVEVAEAVKAALAGMPVDLVMSDMAPNMSGARAVDQPRSMFLAELALDFATQVLRRGGAMLVKLFQGEGFQEYVSLSRSRFETVRLRKPEASRSGNREIYLVARNFGL